MLGLVTLILIFKLISVIPITEILRVSTPVRSFFRRGDARDEHGLWEEVLAMNTAQIGRRSFSDVYRPKLRFWAPVRSFLHG